jgi:hypothetical protein
MIFHQSVYGQYGKEFVTVDGYVGTTAREVAKMFEEDLDSRIKQIAHHNRAVKKMADRKLKAWREAAV